MRFKPGSFSWRCHQTFFEICRCVSKFEYIFILIFCCCWPCCARLETILFCFSSRAHTRVKGLVLDDLNWEKRPYNSGTAYGESKLANVLFSSELGKRREKNIPTFIFSDQLLNEWNECLLSFIASQQCFAAFYK